MYIYAYRPAFLADDSVNCSFTSAELNIKLELCRGSKLMLLVFNHSTPTPTIPNLLSAPCSLLHIYDASNQHRSCKARYTAMMVCMEVTWRRPPHRPQHAAPVHDLNFVSLHPLLPRSLSVPPARYLPLSPPSSCLSSVQSQVAGRGGTCRYRPPLGTPRTSRTYYSLWPPRSTYTPADDMMVNVTEVFIITEFSWIQLGFNYYFSWFHSFIHENRLTICVLAFFFSASPCFLFTTSSSFFSSQFSMVSKQITTGNTVHRSESNNVIQHAEKIYILMQVNKLLLRNVNKMLLFIYYLPYRLNRLII